ncbi:MAG: hypothetical protein JST26_05545 [Bacteroidetes bacterium]|nr:hypothetical protein [Bacteroidota bacterium]
MIRAEHAQRIMQRYEDDYDNFLDKLKAKRKAKKHQAANAKAEADHADKTLAEAQAYKPAHLQEKAKALLDKVGGIEGASNTANNVIKYFKTNTPSDYQVDFGKGADDQQGQGKGTDPVKMFGISAIVLFGGGTILTLAVLYGIYRLVKKPAPPVIQAPAALPASA